MSKPREFAHLIKNKFGSADNINTLSRELHVTITKTNPLPPSSISPPINCANKLPFFHIFFKIINLMLSLYICYLFLNPLGIYQCLILCSAATTVDGSK